MQTILDTRAETEATILAQSQERLLTWMGKIVVTTEAEQKNAEDLLIHGRQALKDIEAKRKELLQPVNETRDRINALFKPLTDKLNMGLHLVNEALQVWHKKQAEEAAELQRIALAEQAAKLAEAEETGEIVSAPAVADIPAAPAKTSRANLGSVTYREDIDVIIVNPLQVPRQYCDPNISRIRAAAKSGVKEIPGVLITTKTTPVTRGGK